MTPATAEPGTKTQPESKADGDPTTSGLAGQGKIVQPMGAGMGALMGRRDRPGPERPPAAHALLVASV